MKNKDYKELYNIQVNRLGIKLPYLKDFFLKQKDIISKAKRLLTDERNIAFLLVPSITWEELIGIAENNNNKKQINTPFGLSNITDRFNTPTRRPYFIFNINTESTRNHAPNNIIDDKKKRFLTAYETLSFIAHTEVLQSCNLWSLGSGQGRNWQIIPGISCKRKKVGQKIEVDKIALHFSLKEEVEAFRNWSSPFRSYEIEAM